MAFRRHHNAPDFSNKEFVQFKIEQLCTKAQISGNGILIVNDIPFLNEYVQSIGKILRESKISKLSVLNSQICSKDLQILVKSLTRQDGSCQLTSLNLSGSIIGNDLIHYISQSSKLKESLEILDLSWINIGDQQMKFLSLFLRETNVLTTVHLTHNKLSSKGLELFFKSCSLCLTLTSLSIVKSRGLSDHGLSNFAQILCSHPSLKFVNLSECNIRSSGIEYLAAFINASNSVIHLDISYNGRLAKIRALFSNLVVNSTLLFLNLSGCGINSDQCIYIANALKLNTRLVYLCLSDNPLRDAGIKLIARGLKNNNTIESLDLRNCGFGSCGEEVLSRCLLQNQCLSFLNLGQNFVGSQGGNGISRLLKHNLNIIGLNLNSVNIADDAAMMIFESLENGYPLKYLSLRKSSINHNALMRLSNALGNKDCRLLSLDLGHMKLQATSSISLMDNLRMNVSLQFLNLDGLNMEKSFVDYLCKVLLENKTLKSLSLCQKSLDFTFENQIIVALSQNQTLSYLCWKHEITQEDKFLKDKLLKNYGLINLREVLNLWESDSLIDSSKDCASERVCHKFDQKLESLEQSLGVGNSCLDLKLKASSQFNEGLRYSIGSYERFQILEFPFDYFLRYSSFTSLDLSYWEQCMDTFSQMINWDVVNIISFIKRDRYCSILKPNPNSKEKSYLTKIHQVFIQEQERVYQNRRRLVVWDYSFPLHIAIFLATNDYRTKYSNLIENVI